MICFYLIEIYIFVTFVNKLCLFNNKQYQVVLCNYPNGDTKIKRLIIAEKIRTIIIKVTRMEFLCEWNCKVAIAGQDAFYQLEKGRVMGNGFCR